MSLIVAAVLVFAQEPPPVRPPDRAPQNQEQLKKVVEDLTARIKENPNDAEAYLGRSRAKRGLGDRKGADEDQAKAFELNPELRRRPVPQPPQPPGPGRRPFEGEGEPPMREEDIRGYLQEFEPETGRRIRSAREEGRGEEAERLLQEAGRRMRATNELRERDPKAFERLDQVRKLEREAFTLGEEARRAPPEQREEKVKKLDELLGRLFDLREETRVKEVEELKRRVADLEKALEARKAGKGRIVQSRRKELLGEPRDDDW